MKSLLLALALLATPGIARAAPTCLEAFKGLPLEHRWVPRESLGARILSLLSTTNEKGYVSDRPFPADIEIFGEAVRDKPTGAKITLVDYELRGRIADAMTAEGYPAGPSGERIVSNTAYETSLIDLSREAAGAPEVAHTRIFDEHGRLVASAESVAYGIHDAVTEDAVLANIPQAPRGAFVIEIAHTHPAYEVLAKVSSEKNFRMSDFPLSPADLNVGRRISRSYPDLYLRMKAVTPNGYNYQITFHRGRVVKDPLVRTARLN